MFYCFILFAFAFAIKIILIIIFIRYEKQLKELKEKGYYTMADGTKSTDFEDAGKKKKAKSETKPGKKRASALTAGKKSSSKAAAGKKAAAKNTKKSDDDLDIESDGSAGEGSEALEDSA